MSLLFASIIFYTKYFKLQKSTQNNVTNAVTPPLPESNPYFSF